MYMSVFRCKIFKTTYNKQKLVLTLRKPNLTFLTLTYFHHPASCACYVLQLLLHYTTLPGEFYF